LPARQPPAPQTAEDRPRQAAAAWTLGREPGAVVRVGPPEPPDRETRFGRDLRRRPRPRRAGSARPRLPRRHLLRGVSRQERGRRRVAEVLQAVLFPWTDRLARDAGDARLDPWGGGAGVKPSPGLGG